MTDAKLVALINKTKDKFNVKLPDMELKIKLR